MHKLFAAAVAAVGIPLVALAPCSWPSPHRRPALAPTSATSPRRCSPSTRPLPRPVQGCRGRCWPPSATSSPTTAKAASTPTTGEVLPPILGPPLDGADGLARIPDPTSPDGWAHAQGLMQFLPSTWATWGRVAPGRPPGATPDINNAWDAIYTAAAYLCGPAGRITNLNAAILRYNPSAAYLQAVLTKAAQYQGGTVTGQGNGHWIDFARGLLGALDAPDTLNNEAALLTWMAGEQPPSSPNAAFNPLNIQAHGYPGEAGITGTSGTGQFNYTDWQTGIQQTADFLSQGRYQTRRGRLPRRRAPQAKPSPPSNPQAGPAAATAADSPAPCPPSSPTSTPTPTGSSAAHPRSRAAGSKCRAGRYGNGSSGCARHSGRTRAGER